MFFPALLTEEFEVTFEYELVKNLNVKLLTNTIIPAHFEVLVTKDLKQAEIIFKIFNLNIIDVKAQGNTKLNKIVPEMIKYDIDYAVLEGLAMEGKINVELDITKPEKKVAFNVTPKTLPMVSLEFKEADWIVKVIMLLNMLISNQLFTGQHHVILYDTKCSSCL